MNHVQPRLPVCGIPRAEAEAKPEPRIVPFDQLITFDLTGKRDNVLTKVTNISVEGRFVAVAMSYSVRPEVQIDFGPPPPDPYRERGARGALGNLSMGHLLDGFQIAMRRVGVSDETTIDALQQKMLRTGFKLNPPLAGHVLSQGGLSFQVENLLGAENRLFQTVTYLEGEINFLYSIIDNATSREMQSEPIHNLAGLGIANGDRPFRFFPQPIVFTPRSVIRVQITEISGTGRLYFVLQGYKILGA